MPFSSLRLFLSHRLPRGPDTTRVFQLFSPLLPNLDPSHLPSLLDLIASHLCDIADPDDAQPLDFLPRLLDPPSIPPEKNPSSGSSRAKLLPRWAQLLVDPSAWDKGLGVGEADETGNLGGGGGRLGGGDGGTEGEEGEVEGKDLEAVGGEDEHRVAGGEAEAGLEGGGEGPGLGEEFREGDGGASGGVYGGSVGGKEGDGDSASSDD